MARRQLVEEVHLRGQGHMAHVRPGDDEAVGVDRIGRVRHQHRVARPHGRQRQVGQALLGADGHDGLGLRVQVHVEAVPVPVADGPAQARDALGDRVAVGVLAAAASTSLSTICCGRGLVRIAHAEVDDVLAAGPRLGLQLD